MTALGIAAAVAAGERSARSVLEEHLDRIAEREPEIGAFTCVMADEARAAASEIDAAVARGERPGPLAGVPVAVKDNLCTRDAPTTCSSRILEGWRPPYDATAVQRLRAAGAVIVGKTNLDEFAMGSSTESSAFGPTRNPRDLSRVPGGSSGGSAAAVAAGFAPLALGTDTGGSVRQPAALCGAVGLKPTYGSVSRYGLVAFASSLDQIGPIAASVADAAALFEVISGPDPLDSTSFDPAAVAALRAGEGRAGAAGRTGAAGDNSEDGEDEAPEGIEGLRIGVLAELCGGLDGGGLGRDGPAGGGGPGATGVEGVAADVAARTAEAVAALEGAGAVVEAVSVPSTVLGLSAYYLIAPAEASSNLARYDGVRYGLRVEGFTAAEMNVSTRTAGFGAEVKRRIMLGTYVLSAGYYDAFYAKALRARALIRRELDEAYGRFDLLVCPTAPTTAFELGAKTADPLSMYLNDVCTIPSNLAGHPAISVPFGLGEDGLPVGVQIMGPACAEHPAGRSPLWRAAAALERAAPSPTPADPAGGAGP